MTDANKQSQDTRTDNHPVEDIIDSDALFDLDMPLDEPEDDVSDGQEEARQEIQATAVERETTDIDEPLEQPIDDAADDELLDDSSLETLTSTENTDDSTTLDNDILEPLEDTLTESSSDNTVNHVSETPESLEQDLEHLLDRSEPDSAIEHVSVDQPSIPDEGITHNNSPKRPENKPMQAMPATETAPEKPLSGMIKSLILTLALVAILIASAAVWLGLNASQKQSKLASASSNLEQQIKVLHQLQQQQNTKLTHHIERLEKQLNALTQVVASKKAAQWRSSIEHPTTMPQSKQGYKPDKPVAKANTIKQEYALKKNRAKKSVITPASTTRIPAKSKPSIKESNALLQLSMYEVAPGTVKGWVVNIFSVQSKSIAQKKIRQLKARNIDAKFVRVKVKGKIWYRVRGSGFKNEASATIFQKYLKKSYDIDAWHNYLK